MFSTFESKLPNTIFCMKQAEMVRERQRTYGSKNRMFTRGEVPRQAERMCSSKSRTHTLLSCERWYATAENMRFFEPHVLSHGNQYARGRECVVRRTMHSL